MSNSEEQEHFLSIDPHLSSIQTATELSSSEIQGNNSVNSGNNSKIHNLLSNPTITVTSTANSQYYKQQKSSGLLNSKTGDLSVPRPIIQANNNNNNNNNNNSSSNNNNSSTAAAAAAYKITQVGPVIGSNVIVSRMDGSNATRPTSASPIPISGPLANINHNNNGGNTNYYFNNNSNNLAKAPINPRSTTTTSVAQIGNTGNFYHTTANNVTKFTNMTVSNAAGAKNPLKPTHYTVPISSNMHGTNPVNTTNTNHSASNSIVNLSTHPNSNLTAPNTSGIAPKTTLKAADLIHILPNLFSTLKRRNSNSSASGNSNGTGPGMGKGYNGTGTGTGNAYFNSNSTNTLAAAVAEAASNSGKTLTTTTAAALVAEQLLNAAASGPFSDDSSPSPPPQQHSLSKRIKIHDPSSLQCEVCGKSYKHRNCLSKHMWEHHESWEHTKKVCQTKHQQVQLLEAAQVLAEIVSGVRSSVSNRNSSSSESSSEDEGESDAQEQQQQQQQQQQEGYIEDGIREMSIVPTATMGEEDENISIGEGITN